MESDFKMKPLTSKVPVSCSRRRDRKACWIRETEGDGSVVWWSRKGRGIENLEKSHQVYSLPYQFVTLLKFVFIYLPINIMVIKGNWEKCPQELLLSFVNFY